LGGCGGGGGAKEVLMPKVLGGGGGFKPIALNGQLGSAGNFDVVWSPPAFGGGCTTTGRGFAAAGGGGTKGCPGFRPEPELAAGSRHGGVEGGRDVSAGRGAASGRTCTPPIENAFCAAALEAAFLGSAHVAATRCIVLSRSVGGRAGAVAATGNSESGGVTGAAIDKLVVGWSLLKDSVETDDAEIGSSMADLTAAMSFVTSMFDLPPAMLRGTLQANRPHKKSLSS